MWSVYVPEKSELTLGQLFAGMQSACIFPEHFERAGGEGADQPTRLVGSGLVHVLGQALPYFVELIAVRINDEGIQVAVDEVDASALIGLDQIDQGDGPRYTFHYQGHDYIALIYPFCD